jgi:hypothetical protein
MTSLKVHFEVTRRVFMVLSPRSLVYAREALKSLLSNALETIDLHLITDSASDKQLLSEEMAGHRYASPHLWTIHAKEELRDQEATIFALYPNLRLFRAGHPCWRKITDPLLLSKAGEEIIVLDPDLYFPNRFNFQRTLDRELLLMWQKPSCLHPGAIVEAAFKRHISLAHHVDIGVAQWRAEADLDWLEWLLEKLDLANHPNAMFIMHIEAIVWAAIAMRSGGGYLSPDAWYCWHRSQPKRLLRKMGVPGQQLLRLERFATMKCFHAGGEAKYWLQEAKLRGWMDSHNLLTQQSAVLPFVELTPRLYRRDQRLKMLVRNFGYYRLFPNRAVR